MKKLSILIAVLILISGSLLFAEDKPAEQKEKPVRVKSNLIAFRIDAAFIIGNTHWPEPGLGFSTHARIDFAIWETKLALGSLETGVWFSYQTPPAPVTVAFNQTSGISIKANQENHIPSIAWSIGHSFRFLESRRLFFGVYALLGYTWRINKISITDNTSSLTLPANSLAVTVGAFTAAFSINLGYDFLRNMGVFAYGNYILPVEPGVTGNYIFGLGLTFML